MSEAEYDPRTVQEFRCQECYRMIEAPFTSDDPVNELCGSCKPYEAKALSWYEKLFFMFVTFFSSTMKAGEESGSFLKNPNDNGHFVQPVSDSRGSNQYHYPFLAAIGLGFGLLIFNSEFTLETIHDVRIFFVAMLAYFGL